MAEKHPAAQPIEAELSRDLGLISAMAIGVGTMIAAGIFTLSGLAVRNVGSGAIVAFLVAAVVAMFTALTYCEFAALYPRSGEGYLYARKTFPPKLAWFVGFCLFLGYTSSCAFYISSLSVYFEEFVYHLPWQALSGVLALLVLTLLNMKGTKESGSFQVVVTGGKVLLLCWFVAGGLPSVSTELLAERFVSDAVQLGSTAAMVFITFFGFSAIAAGAGEVKDPVVTIPRAIFLSMGIVTVLYTLVVMVILAADLTSYDEAAMGEAARRFLGPVGGMVIVGGALFSMISASNASIMAGSRVAMTMGNAGHLPSIMGRIHPLTKTPVVSLIAVGLAIFGFAVSLELEDLAHYADTVLLLALILVNVALIVHRRRHPDLERPFRVPLVPLVPVLGILANLYLMSNLLHHLLPLGLALGTLALGFVGFLGWQQIAGPAPAAERAPLPEPELEPPRFRVLLPYSNPSTFPALLELAATFARERDGELIIARIVEVPEQAPTADLDVLQREARRLREAREMCDERAIPAVPVVSIGHDVAQAILGVAAARGCGLIILGWKGHTSTRERIFGEITDAVVARSPCDILVVKPVGSGPIERLLLPTAGGDHAEGAAAIAAVLAEAGGAHITVATVLAEGASDEARGRARALLARTAERVGGQGVSQRLLVGDSVPEVILETSGDFDAILIGATGRRGYRELLFGTIPEAIARDSTRTVLMFKQGPRR